MFELCTPRTNSVPASERDKHTNTVLLNLQPARVVRSSANFAWWIGDRTRRTHQKRCPSFCNPTHSFPTGCTEKFGLIDRRAVSQQ